MHAAPWVFLTVVALAAPTPRAAADGARTGTPVTWVGPNACPSEADVRLQVERLIGQSLETGREQQLAFSATVREREQGGYELELLVADREGEHRRRLEHAQCAKLAEAAALLIALAIDPERVEARKNEAEAPSSPVSPPSGTADPERRDGAMRARQTARPTRLRIEPVRRGPPPATVSKRARRSLDWRIGTYAWLGTGSLPRLSPGVSAELGLVYGHSLRLSGYAAGWAEQSEPITNAPQGARVVVGLLAAGALACWTPPGRRWESSACLGAELGDLTGSAEGQSVEKPALEHALWSAALVQAAVGYRLSPRLLAVVRTAGGFPLERPRFGVDNRGNDQDVFQPDRWLVRAGLGIELALP